MTRTLHVRVGTDVDRSDLEDRLAAIDAGEDVEPQPSIFSVEDVETLGRIFRPTNLALLQAIAEHEPESIRALARAVDRHPPEVLENVTELENYGLIELREEGRSKRPVLFYDDIDIEIPLRQVVDEADDSAVSAD